MLPLRIIWNDEATKAMRAINMTFFHPQLSQNTGVTSRPLVSAPSFQFASLAKGLHSFTEISRTSVWVDSESESSELKVHGP
jgi:hypothetical protein